MFIRNEYEKHLTLIRKRINLFKEAKDIKNALKLLNWLSSSQAESFYPQNLSIPSKFSLWQEQFDLLTPIESAQIVKDIETGRMRLNSSTDSLERLVDRCHVQNYSRDLTEILRNISTVKPEKFYEILVKRLLKIVLSDFCSNEELRQEYADELLIMTPFENCYTINHIKYNLNTNIETAPTIHDINDDYFVGPRNVLDSLKEAAERGEHEKVLKLYNDLEIVTKKWSRAFKIIQPIKTQLPLKLKLKSLISLNYFDDALQLINQFSNEDLLDDLLFDSVISVLETSSELSRVILLIESKLMQIDPENPDLILKLVDNLIKAQRFDEAAEYLQAIPSAYPNLDPKTEARLTFSTGLCSWHTGDHSKSSTLSHFLNSAKLNPEESKHFEWIGKFYWRIEKDSERALKCFTKALNLDTGNLLAAILFSEVTLTVNQPENISIVTQLLKPFTKISSQSRNRRLFYYHGIALFHLNNFLDSAVAFQSALKGSQALSHDDTTDPSISDENCLQWLGEAYLRSNRLGSAAKTFTRLASVSANAADSSAFMTAQIGLAAVHLKSNNPIDAVDSLEEINQDSCLKVQLDKAKSFSALARFYLRQGRFISAMGALQNSLDNSPLNTAEGMRIAADILCLAHKYSDIGSFEKFKNVLVDGVEINSGLQEIYDELASDSLVGKSCKLALAALTEAFKDPKTHSLSAFWLQLAVCLSAAGEFSDFVISAALNAVKENDATSILKAQGHQIQGLIYAQNPQTHQQAQHHFITALKYHESFALWLDLGRFYLKAGDWQLASESFKKALAVDQEDLVAAFELAKCSGTVEGKESAVQVAQRAFTTQPVLFNEEFAKVLVAETEGELAKYAAVYLKRLHPELNFPNLQPLNIEIPQFDTKIELLNYLNASEHAEIWLHPAAAQIDCEYLLKRPENEVTQSGWRAVVEGLLPSVKERTKKELEELNK